MSSLFVALCVLACGAEGDIARRCFVFGRRARLLRPQVVSRLSFCFGGLAASAAATSAAMALVYASPEPLFQAEVCVAPMMALLFVKIVAALVSRIAMGDLLDVAAAQPAQ